MVNDVVFRRKRRLVLLRIAESHDRAARVGEYAVYGAVVGEIVDNGAGGGAEHDEARVEIDRGGKDLDGRMTVGDAGFDLGAAEFVGTGFRGEDAEFAHCG